MKKNKMSFLFLLPVLLPQPASEQVDVKVTFDENGVPQSATGQKQLVDDQKQVTNDGDPNTLVVSDTAKANYAAAIKKANDDLETQIVSDNYVDGDFQAPQAQAATAQA